MVIEDIGGTAATADIELVVMILIRIMTRSRTSKIAFTRAIKNLGRNAKRGAKHFSIGEDFGFCVDIFSNAKTTGSY